MKRIAVILSGCGYLDGSEIHEAVITLLALSKAGITPTLFAPNNNQHDVVNHLTGEQTNEKRNILVEAARIARGNIQDLSEAKAQNFDGLILPGGFGAAKNLSDFALKGKHCTVLPELKSLVLDFYKQHKPIGAICVSPVIITAILAEIITPSVTIGEDKDTIIEALGGNHIPCKTHDFIVDAEHRIVTCPAYMQEAPLADIAAGIEGLVSQVLAFIS